MRLDEILDALPGAGLKLTHLGWHTGADPWGATIRDIAQGPDGVYWGQGNTPVEAMAGALRMAGVELTDE
jgi:hypothetical protein